MKGIILTLLQTVTEEVHGEELWDQVLADVDVRGAYTALGDYPDNEVHALVQALGARTGRDPGEVLRWFGRRAMPHLATRYPSFFSPPDPVSFVATLHDVIHSEVRKLHPGAAPPDLSFSEIGERRITIEYRSARHMSDLAIGFLHGAADTYDHTVEVGRTDLAGDGTHVLLHCTFSPS